MSKLDIKYISIELFDIINLIIKKKLFNKFKYFYDIINLNLFDNIYKDIISSILLLFKSSNIIHKINGIEFNIDKLKVNIEIKKYNQNIIKFSIIIKNE